MKKIINWCKQDWKKINKTKSLIALIFTISIMLGLFLLAILWRKEVWHNALSTVGAIGIALLLISFAIRLSMFESFLILTKNMSIKRHNKHYKQIKSKQKMLYTKQTYQQENKSKAWIPFILYGLFFLLLISIGLIAYAIM